MNLPTKQKQDLTDIKNKLMVTKGATGRGKDKSGPGTWTHTHTHTHTRAHTLLYMRQATGRTYLQHRELYSVFCENLNKHLRQDE